MYKLTANFPSEERFGLTNQIRRASVSIDSNLAEGCPKGHCTLVVYRFAYGRDGDKEFARFLDIAQGSAYEVRCQILIARDLQYLALQKSELLLEKINEVCKMINSLNQKLKAKSYEQMTFQFYTCLERVALRRKPSRPRSFAKSATPLK